MCVDLCVAWLLGDGEKERRNVVSAANNFAHRLSLVRREIYGFVEQLIACEIPEVGGGAVKLDGNINCRLFINRALPLLLLLLPFAHHHFRPKSQFRFLLFVWRLPVPALKIRLGNWRRRHSQQRCVMQSWGGGVSLEKFAQSTADLFVLPTGFARAIPFNWRQITWNREVFGIPSNNKYLANVSAEIQLHRANS